LASNYEGWGMTVVEAMVCGCPVVMTDVGCAGELVVNGENGLVTPAGDRAALVGSINKLIADPLFREKFKKTGLVAVNRLPNKGQYLSDYKKSWEALI